MGTLVLSAALLHFGNLILCQPTISSGKNTCAHHLSVRQLKNYSASLPTTTWQLDFTTYYFLRQENQPTAAMT